MVLKGVTSGCRLNIIAVYNVSYGYLVGGISIYCRTLTSMRCTVHLFISYYVAVPVKSNVVQYNSNTLNLQIHNIKYRI